VVGQKTHANDRSEKRVASVLSRATALSEELSDTIAELEAILRRPDEDLEPYEPPRKGE